MHKFILSFLLLIVSSVTWAAASCEGELLPFQAKPERGLGVHADPLYLTPDEFLARPDLRMAASDISRYLQVTKTGTASLESARTNGLRYVSRVADWAELKSLLATGVLRLNASPDRAEWLKLLTERQYGQELKAPPNKILLVFDMGVLNGMDFSGRRRYSERPAELATHTSFANLARDLMNEQSTHWSTFGHAMTRKASLPIWNLRAIVVGDLWPQIPPEVSKILDESMPGLLHEKWTVSEITTQVERPLVLSLSLNPLQIYALKQPLSDEEVRELRIEDHVAFGSGLMHKFDDVEAWIPFAKSIFYVTDLMNNSVQGHLIQLRHTTSGTPILSFADDRTGEIIHSEMDDIQKFQLLEYIPNGPDGKRIGLNSWDLYAHALEKTVQQKRLLIISRP